MKSKQPTPKTLTISEIWELYRLTGPDMVLHISESLSILYKEDTSQYSFEDKINLLLTGLYYNSFEQFINVVSEVSGNAT